MLFIINLNYLLIHHKIHHKIFSYKTAEMVKVCLYSRNIWYNSQVSYFRSTITLHQDYCTFYFLIISKLNTSDNYLQIQDMVSTGLLSKKRRLIA